MSMNAFEKMACALKDSGESWKLYPNYYLFEGYDVQEREAWVYEQAISDGADLRAPFLMLHVGEAPHPFQNGYILSMSRFRAIMAANQNGKSLAVYMEQQMRMTGEIPFAYRYPKGHDTGIARLCTKENIRRFGRRSRETGAIIDFDDRAMKDDSWDCGNVIGAGVFPSSKIVVPGGTMRLGAPQKIIQQSWWPAYTGRARDTLGKFFLASMIDRERSRTGIAGANKQEHQIFFKGDRTLHIISYDAGAKAFEGIKVPTYLDEEPEHKGEEIIATVITHSSDWSLSETPIYGITYSKARIFPELKPEGHAVFHATAYDCPYHTRAELEVERKEMLGTPWEIGARIYGLPTGQTGKPYYDRAKINLWIQRFPKAFQFCRFVPQGEWDGIKTQAHRNRPGLLDIEVKKEIVRDDDKSTVWRVYEDRQDMLAYVSASDQAEGADLPQDVADWSVAVIGRPRSLKDPVDSRPVVCATLRSSLPTPHFARHVLYACRYFNNALMAAESAKGFANATFKEVCSEWPWWFRDSVTMDATHRAKEHLGFCPTDDRRETVFDVLLRDHFDAYGEDEYPEIPDEQILREAAAAIVGVKKNGTTTRCDHAPDGTLDALMAYGILHFAMQDSFFRQIQCHGSPQPRLRRKTWLELAEEAERRGHPEITGIGESMTRMR